MNVSVPVSRDALSPACQLASGAPRFLIRVIGPVELVVEGRQVSLRSSRTRRLVAMLALYRDRLVSRDRLIDAVGGEDLPADPNAALLSQLSRVRSSLRAAGAGIETMSGGYRLRSDVIAVDVALFEDALALARAPERTAAQRADLLDQAIAMVRGAAFEDLEVEDAYIEARRVQELAVWARLAATAAHIEAAGVIAPPVRRAPAAVVDVIGRNEDLDAIGSLLASRRIVTLTGPGGVGKTTLALAAAEHYCADSGVANAFVDLAPVSSPGEVPDAFARALGVDRPGEQPWVDRLAEAIGGQRLLLLVDNAEHLVDTTAEIVAEIAARTDVVVLVTSRVPLGVAGEQLWVVEPLDGECACDLFYERARAVRPSWATTSEDAASVGGICRRVDGLPLAIELAAAQLRWRTAAEVLASLGEPLRALDPLRPASGRQPDLRSVIARSYRLLDEHEQSFLDCLGVFAGGFTVETAAAVCDERGTVGDADALRTIGSLVQHSLVRPSPSRAATRYSLLDTIRHYALERLDLSGRSSAARDRHASAMFNLVDRASREMWGPDEASWVGRLDDERADICAAHQHLFAAGNIQGAVRLASAAYWVSWPRGWSDLRGLIGTAVTENLQGPPDLLAPAFGARADLALHAGETEYAVRYAERALAAAEGSVELASFGQGVIADAALFDGRTDEARAGWARARAGLHSGWPVPAPWATAAMALAALYGGDPDEAVTLAAEAVEGADMLGCPTARCFARFASGEAAADLDPVRAQQFLTDAISIAEGASVAFVANLARLSLATCLARSGDPTGALSQYPILLREWRRSGHWAQQWMALRTLVPILVHVGAVDDAGAVLGGLRAHGQAEAWGIDGQQLRASAAELREGLGSGYEATLASGAGATPVELVVLADQASARAAGAAQSLSRSNALE